MCLFSFPWLSLPSIKPPLRHPHSPSLYLYIATRLPKSHDHGNMSCKKVRMGCHMLLFQTTLQSSDAGVGFFDHVYSKPRNVDMMWRGTPKASLVMPWLERVWNIKSYQIDKCACACERNRNSARTDRGGILYLPRWLFLLYILH